MSFTVPALIDGMDNRTQIDYDASPDRIYVVDADGRIAYNGAKGPKGFKPSHIVGTLDALIPVEPVGRLAGTWGALRK